GEPAARAVAADHPAVERQPVDRDGRGRSADAVLRVHVEQPAGVRAMRSTSMELLARIVVGSLMVVALVASSGSKTGGRAVTMPDAAAPDVDAAPGPDAAPPALTNPLPFDVKWARAWQVGSVLATTSDAAGNLYLVGQFTGEQDFDPGPGVDLHTGYQT